jgi:hypothetical protein
MRQRARRGYMTKDLGRFAICVGLSAALLAGAAGAEPEYLEKSVHGRTVRLPLLSGFTPVCENDVSYAARVRSLAPASHEFLTCASDRRKWEALRAGNGSDLYPLIVVTAVREQPSGRLSPDEFARLKELAHERLGDMLASNGTPPSSVRAIDEAASTSTVPRTTNSYEQQLRGFFDAPSKAPSFSYMTSRNGTITEGGRTYEVREVTAISTVYVRGDLIQLMMVDGGVPSPDASRLRNLTKQWLDAFNEVTP